MIADILAVVFSDVGVLGGSLTAAVGAVLGLRARAALWALATVAVALLGFLACAGIYRSGVAACEARVASAVSVETARLANDISKVISTASALRLERDAARAEQGRKSEEFADEVAKRPDADQCLVTDADAQRLR